MTAQLSWTSVSTADYYVLYRKKSGKVEMEDWQSISTFDFEGNEIVKVLNAYPSEEGCEGRSGWTVTDANFTYSDGTNKTIAKSSSLKIWMEGGEIS